MKEELTGRIKKWIDHCFMIAMCSNHDEYKSMKRLNHTGKIKNDLYPLLKPASTHSLRDVCQFTLILQRDLFGILPVVTNNSFRSSFADLEQIIIDCKKILNPNQ